MSLCFPEELVAGTDGSALVRLFGAACRSPIVSRAGPAGAVDIAGNGGRSPLELPFAAFDGCGGTGVANDAKLSLVRLLNLVSRL